MSKAKKVTAAPRTSRKGKRGRLAIARREEVVRLALALVPITTIATRIGVSREHVHRMLAEPEVATRLQAARSGAFHDSLVELRGLTRRAVGVLAEEMEGTHPPTRVRAAVEVIALAGAAAPKRIDVHTTLTNASDEELWNELERLRQRTLAAGGNVPAEPVIALGGTKEDTDDDDEAA